MGRVLPWKMGPMRLFWKIDLQSDTTAKWHSQVCKLDLCEVREDLGGDDREARHSRLDIVKRTPM